MSAPYAKLPAWADYGLIPLINLAVAFLVAGLVGDVLFPQRLRRGSAAIPQRFCSDSAAIVHRLRTDCAAIA